MTPKFSDLKQPFIMFMNSMHQELGQGTEGMVRVYSTESEVWNHWRGIHSHIWHWHWLQALHGGPSAWICWVPPSIVPGNLGLESQRRETSRSQNLLWPSPGGHAASPPSGFTVWCHQKPSWRFTAGVGGHTPPSYSMEVCPAHCEKDMWGGIC